MTEQSLRADLREALVQYTSFHSATGTPFFASPKNHAALIAELESWRGTPFVKTGAAGAKKGLRSNCVTFVAGVFENLRAIQAVQWPQYVVSGGGEPMLLLLIRSLTQSGLAPLSEVTDQRPKDAMRVGDVILVSTGRKLHHLAIFAGDNTIWHSTEQGRGVCTGNVNDPLITRYAHSVWRAYDQGNV